MPRLLIPVALVVALVGIGTLTRYARERTTAPAATPAPASAWFQTPYTLDSFTASDIEGRRVSSASWQGQVAVVNFWATWCLPCRREIPALVSLQEKYRGRLVIVGIVDDKANDQSVRQFASSLRINYPIVRTTLEISRRFPSVEALPMTVLVDPRGQVVAAYAGEIDPAELERDVLRLLPTSSGAAVPRG